MQPDSLPLVSVHLPAGALPWQILAILLVGFFVVLGMLIRKAGEFKQYASGDFPTHSATVLVGLGAFAIERELYQGEERRQTARRIRDRMVAEELKLKGE